MESKGTFFILIIVVAVLTLTLAALAGYLFLVQGTPGAKAGTEEASADKHGEGKEEPLEEENIMNVNVFESKSYFNLKNEDPNKIAIVQVNVVLQCPKKLKEKENSKVNMEEKLAIYLPAIQERVTRFFMGMTLEEVKNRDTLDKSKELLQTEINDILTEGMEKKEKIVYNVYFSQWIFQ